MRRTLKIALRELARERYPDDDDDDDDDDYDYEEVFANHEVNWYIDTVTLPEEITNA